MTRWLSRNKPLLSIALIVALLLSGCTGGGEPKKTVAPPPTTEATHTSENGGVEGEVLSDELLPVQNAEVGIQGASVPTTRTDSLGKFAFSDVPPGDYTIVAAALGFREQAKKITVVAGEIAEVRFTLASIPTGPTYQVNELTPETNIVWLHIKSAQPRYWLSTEQKNSTANSQVGGYNPLGFVIGSEAGAATWAIPFNPELARTVLLDQSKTIDVTIFIGGCFEGVDSGYVTVTTRLMNGETEVFAGGEKTADYKGNLALLTWNLSPAVDTLDASQDLVWHVRAQGVGSQICLGAYDKAASNIIFPVKA